MENNIKRSKIKRVEHVGYFGSENEPEYVYDVGVEEDTPYFFADNILVHNSCYFSLDPLFNDEDSPFSQMEVTKENVAKLYDEMAKALNSTFGGFMDAAFNTERENVAESGLFIKKKRYAILIYDAGGKRVDKDGKPGKVKAMGVETKRSDTPEYIQEFLEQILLKVLMGVPKNEVIEFIKDFRINTIHKMSNKEPWKLGRPTACNGLTAYYNAVTDADRLGAIGEHTGKVMIPGHVRAAMNWNAMIDINDDQYSGKLTDGSKIIVCDLLSNIYDFKSIARPVDLEENQIPQWFKDLPFFVDHMEQNLIDEKLNNLIGILNWDLSKTTGDNTLDEMFEEVSTSINTYFSKKKKKEEKEVVIEDTAFGDLFS